MEQISPPVENNRQARRQLLTGFGGLLFLLAFAGLYGISAVRAIQNRNEHIRVVYVARDRTLQKLRSDIYLSGTYARDLLLERDPALASSRRTELDRARARINVDAAAYERSLPDEERLTFQNFKMKLNFYLQSLDSVLAWSSPERERLGYAFVNRSLLPKRMELVALTDKLSELNQTLLEKGNKQVQELFTNFQSSQTDRYDSVVLIRCATCRRKHPAAIAA